MRVDSSDAPVAASVPKGYGPAQFHAAYSLPTTSPVPQTIAVVDAFSNPTVARDLRTYDQTFGLAAFPRCGAGANISCLKVLNEQGRKRPLPEVDPGWAVETSLDVQTAHEICQNCKVVLVEASSDSVFDLARAEKTAVKAGADVISNSFGGPDVGLGWFFDHPNVAVVAAAGDYRGFGPESPSSYSSVIAVGGTTLSLGPSDAYGSESAWAKSVSGCAFFRASPWQLGLPNWSETGCGNFRAVADVAADADPATGAAVYDSTPYKGHSGWYQIGGTSLSAPIIAGTYALAANSSSVAYPAAITYAAPGGLHDVTSGASGSCASIMCQAGIGYDGPTGLGTPNGIGSF